MLTFSNKFPHVSKAQNYNVASTKALNSTLAEMKFCFGLSSLEVTIIINKINRLYTVDFIDYFISI